MLVKGLLTTPCSQASPGNLQEVEDLLFANSDMLVSPLVVAFKLKTVKGAIQVGAAFADATNRQLGVAEYEDNELFSNTEVCHDLYEKRSEF